MSQLVPDGVDGMFDLPYTIHDAIRSALLFLGFEELPKDERPPRAIWFDGERMKAWWAEVERKREERMDSGGSGGGSEQRNSYADELIA